MPSYDIRPLQLRILDILKAIDTVCRDHNLRYCLVAGTLLGAVRHKGFIPWDDDLDIAMPRDDYETLMTHAAEWIPQPYEAKCAETDPAYSGAFAKIIDSSTTLIAREHYAYLAGIYIDVFPLDGMPESRLLQHWQMIRYKYYCKMIYLLHRDPYKHGHGASSWLPLLVRRLYTHDSLHRKVRRVMMRYPFETSRLVIDYDDRNLRGVMQKSVIFPTKPVVFEGETFAGMADNHTYLTKKYGEYMVVPDTDHRRQHNFHYLDYDTPYREYVDTRKFLNNT